MRQVHSSNPTWRRLGSVHSAATKDRATKNSLVRGGLSTPNLVTGDGPASQNFVLIWQTPHQGARYGDVSRVSLSTVRTHYPTVNLGRGDKLSKTQRSVGATETKRVSQCCSRFRTKKRLRRQRHVVHVKVFLWVYTMQVQCGRDHTLRIKNDEENAKNKHSRDNQIM